MALQMYYPISLVGVYLLRSSGNDRIVLMDLFMSYPDKYTFTSSREQSSPIVHACVYATMRSMGSEKINSLYSEVTILLGF